MAETGAHAGTACTSERRVHTRVGVEHAAKARGTPPREPRDALGVRAAGPPSCPTPWQREARPQAQDQRTAAGDGSVTHQARSGGGPGKDVLADTRRSDRGRVYCQFQMPEDLPDDLAVCHGRDNPQRPPLTNRQRAISSAHTHFGSRAQPQRGDPVPSASSAIPCWRGVGMIAPRR